MINKLENSFDDCGTNSEALVYIPDYDVFYRLAFGTGDNLLPEDIEAGYNDYIEITPQKYDIESDSFVDANDFDGGEFLFNNSEFSSMDYKIQNFVHDALAEIAPDYCTPKFYVIAVM